MATSSQPQELTINEYLASIRLLLEGACTKLEQDINAAESQFTKRQTGALVRTVLDIGKQHFDRSVTGTFHEMQWFLTRTKLDRRELAETTVRELVTFLNRTKAIIGSIKRHVRGGVGAAKLIDQEMRALDRSLQLKMKLGGLPDVVVPAKTEARPSRPSPEPVDSRDREEGLFAAFFASPSLSDVGPESPRETALARDAFKERKATSRSIDYCPVRERVEDAWALTRSLHQSVSEELQRLKGGRRNEGDAALVMDYLANVAAMLDQIAMALGGARLATTPEQMDRNFGEAEALAAGLAKAASRFAKNHSKMITGFGGATIFVLLGAAVFTTTFGVSADLASEAPLALLNMPSRSPNGEASD